MRVRCLPQPAPYNMDPQISADQEGETQEMDGGWRDAGCVYACMQNGCLDYVHHCVTLPVLCTRLLNCRL